MKEDFLPLCLADWSNDDKRASLIGGIRGDHDTRPSLFNLRLNGWIEVDPIQIPAE